MLGFYLALATGAAVAANPIVVNSDLPQATVQYSDLNLSTGEGMKRLEARIQNVVTEMCGDVGERDLVRASAIKRCRATAMASAQPQVELATNKTRAGNGAVTAAAVSIVGVK